MHVTVCILFQDSTKGDDGVYLYEPHSRPINYLSFDPEDCGKLFTCSYDGTLRCCDFKSATFQEVHVISAEYKTRSESSITLPVQIIANTLAISSKRNFWLVMLLEMVPLLAQCVVFSS